MSANASGSREVGRRGRRSWLTAEPWAAVNRLTSSGTELGPEQRITPTEALRASTIDAAWQNFEEDQKGSIEPGKLADFTVLAENPLTVDPGRIRDIEVLRTVVGGKTVWDSGL